MSKYELTLTRLLDAPADKLFRCWTTPELMKQWFAPRPYTTPVVETDVRPGGASRDQHERSGGQDCGEKAGRCSDHPGPRSVAHTDVMQLPAEQINP